MSNGYRSKRALAYRQGFDAAYDERQAGLARMADRLDPDEAVLRAFREEDRRSSQLLGAAIAVAMCVFAALIVWATPDIVAWLVGNPAVVVRAR